MEEVIAYKPDDAELWKEKEPKLRVRLDEPFSPFTIENFEGHDITMMDFYIGRSFTLEGFGVGNIAYMRDRLLGFNPQWAEEKAATPLGPAKLSYQFSLGAKTEGVIVPPLELVVALYGRTDRLPPDQLLDFPSFGRAILGRWVDRFDEPQLYPLPIVLHHQFLLPEWKQIRAIYLPEDPKKLSDLKVSFISTTPKNQDRN